MHEQQCVKFCMCITFIMPLVNVTIGAAVVIINRQPSSRRRRRRRQYTIIYAIYALTDDKIMLIYL